MIFLQAFLFLTILGAVRDISTKQSLKSIDPDVLAGYTSLGIFLLTFPITLYYGFPDFSWELLWVTLLTGALYFSFKYVSFTALSLGDISYISPLKGFTTLGAVGVELLIFDTFPNIAGIIGIIILCIGGYIVAMKSKEDSFFEPVRRIFTEKSSQLYLLVILITSFTVVLDKVGVGLSNPYFWVSAMQFFIFLFSITALTKKSKLYLPMIKKNIFSFSLSIILCSIVLLAQMYLLFYLPASYVSAFKTASNIFTVIIGGVFFREKNLKYRIIGVLVMTGGIGLITFSDKIIAFLNSQI